MSLKSGPNWLFTNAVAQWNSGYRIYCQLVGWKNRMRFGGANFVADGRAEWRRENLASGGFTSCSSFRLKEGQEGKRGGGWSVVVVGGCYSTVL